LISQAFLEIFAFWPPFTGIYRDGGMKCTPRLRHEN
jgi:hypothetical protein